MMKLKRITGLIGILILLYGCAQVLLVGVGAGLGVGSYMYVDGSLAVEYPLEYKKAWNSIKRALENMNISTSYSSNSNGTGRIDAVRKDGKKVTIKLKKKGDGITAVSVRVGVLGDRLEAQKIHDEIASAAGI